MRTPLSKVRGLGSAKDGTGHFWHQRLTSVANIPLIIFFVWQIASLSGKPHSAMVERMSSPWVATVMLVVVIAGVYHMKLGMQSIIEDYVHSEISKILLLICNIFFCIMVAALCAISIMKLCFVS